MSDNSKIEWTDASWNPVRGCTKISPGCARCYAETFAERFRGVSGHPYEQGFDLRLVEEKLAEPLHWVRSRMIFVNSMSDLFHEGVPADEGKELPRHVAEAPLGELLIVDQVLEVGRPVHELVGHRAFGAELVPPVVVDA